MKTIAVIGGLATTTAKLDDAKLAGMLAAPTAGPLIGHDEAPGSLAEVDRACPK